MLTLFQWDYFDNNKKDGFGGTSSIFDTLTFPPLDFGLRGSTPLASMIILNSNYRKGRPEDRPARGHIKVTDRTGTQAWVPRVEPRPVSAPRSPLSLHSGDTSSGWRRNLLQTGRPSAKATHHRPCPLCSWRPSADINAHGRPNQ